MRHRSAWSSLFLLAAAAGCESAGDPPTSTTVAALEGGLGFEVVTPTDVIGTYEAEVGVARFVAHAEWERSVEATLEVGGGVIQIDYDALAGEYGTMTLEVHGELGERELRTLSELALELDRAFPYEADREEPTGALLRTYAGYLSEWTLGPTDEPLVTPLRRPRDDEDPERDPPPPKGGGGGGGGGSPPPPSPTPTACAPTGRDDEGVWYMPQCCNGGTFVAWDHDAPGECLNTSYNTCGSASASSGEALATACPGRCGPGCTAIPYYTQDCLDHDLCLMHHPGLSSTCINCACGDELLEAADDVAVIYTSAIGWGHTLPWHSWCWF